MKNFLVRAIAIAAGAALFVGAFLISVVFFAAAFAIALVFAGFFLWRTRHLRKQMRQQFGQQFDQRNVIEGTVIPDPQKADSRSE